MLDVEFEQAWRRRVTMNYKRQALEVLSLTDLIASKRAGRDVDLEDVRLLEAKDLNSKHEE
jgi:hypothetical protein